jgi:hypothetical protein
MKKEHELKKKIEKRKGKEKQLMQIPTLFSKMVVKKRRKQTIEDTLSKINKSIKNNTRDQQ